MVVSVADFKTSLAAASPASGLQPPLAALWWAAKGDWHAAHRIVQDEDTTDAAWVHAYLHRVEGDLDNARYWYRQAKQSFPSASLAQEWAAIATALLRDDSGGTARP
jgi:hypothetical protein